MVTSFQNRAGVVDYVLFSAQLFRQLNLIFYETTHSSNTDTLSGSLNINVTDSSSV